MLDITFNKHCESAIVTRNQGYNSKKVILDVYASFVLQCTVSGR